MAEPTWCQHCKTFLMPGESCDCRAASATKRCPYCRMDIPGDASICGHCRKGVTAAHQISDAGRSLTFLITVPMLLFGLMAYCGLAR